ncbi:MAG: hypothetical protein CL788_00405 [Chloroflexi bacterium]|nr:hypothetical protein [Chloroflexota bacterium]|tara:strand:- start:490 stop:762 length:273 start_codon:yes stop_codon:yes gene_type:complete
MNSEQYDPTDMDILVDNTTKRIALRWHAPAPIIPFENIEMFREWMNKLSNLIPQIEEILSLPDEETSPIDSEYFTKAIQEWEEIILSNAN